MAIIMGKGCIEAIYGLMGWKGFDMRHQDPPSMRMYTREDVHQYLLSHVGLLMGWLHVAVLP